MQVILRDGELLAAHLTHWHGMCIPGPLVLSLGEEAVQGRNGLLPCCPPSQEAADKTGTLLMAALLINPYHAHGTPPRSRDLTTLMGPCHVHEIPASC